MVFRAYDRVLRRLPVFTQAVTTCGLFVLGDLVAQHVVEGTPLSQHDYARTGRLALFGGCIAGPSIALWYPFLQRSIAFKSDWGSVLARVAADQLLFAPTFTAGFIVSTTLMSGRSLTDARARLDEGYKEAIVNNWKLWPAVQILNFAFVPLLYRSLIVNTIATGWNTYLSLLSKRLEVTTGKTE
ncbi:hypothetical protein BC830DRAFT_1167091 [Chytriomyces sp. MP71]|nr:hypothetical protein BC830DRAFT_1167091 [Chytriomyces sp. MP71]